MPKKTSKCLTQSIPNPLLIHLYPIYFQHNRKIHAFKYLDGEVTDAASSEKLTMTAAALVKPCWKEKEQSTTSPKQILPESWEYHGAPGMKDGTIPESSISKVPRSDLVTAVGTRVPPKKGKNNHLRLIHSLQPLDTPLASDGLSNQASQLINYITLHT